MPDRKQRRSDEYTDEPDGDQPAEHADQHDQERQPRAATDQQRAKKVIDRLHDKPAPHREADRRGLGARAVEPYASRNPNQDRPELRNAQDKLARAEIAMQRGQYEDARRLALEAEAAAKLAWATAQNSRVQRALQQERTAR